jgi:hypothetical protein
VKCWGFRDARQKQPSQSRGMDETYRPRVGLVRATAPIRQLFALVAVLVLAVGLAPTKNVHAANDRGRFAQAGAFATRIVRLIGANRYAEAWNSLLPLHQQAAPVERYVLCENETPIPGRVAAVRVLRVWDAPVRVAGVADPARGTKVTVRIEIADESIPARVAVVKTISLVRAAHHWAWLLPAPRYAAYVAGTCP